MPQAVAETTWLEQITQVESRPMPGGEGKIVLYTLANGHRYAIPLSGPVLRETQKLISPVIVAGSLPGYNGHGA